MVAHADSETRYRLRAAEAHSWSSVIVETEASGLFLLSVRTGLLTRIDAEAADRLVATRAYRLWRGDRNWSLLERLPVFAASQISPATVPAGMMPDGDGPGHSGV